MSTGKYAIIISSSILTVIIAFAAYFSYKNTNYFYMPNKVARDKNISKLNNIRPAAVAGAFYPADPDELAEMINGFMDDAKPLAASGTPRMIIAPHAGYEYSGAVAAKNFAAASANKNIDRVIIVGRSHKAYFNGVVLDSHDAWQTPLGILPVDTIFYAKLLSDYDFATTSAEIHAGEHSLEVMVPFIQKTFGLNTKIVPLLFGNDEVQTEKQLADALAELIDENTLIVVSTDLSHYPAPNDARMLDAETIAAIMTNDAAEFHDRLNETMEANPGKADTLACGETAVGAALYLSKRLGLTPTLITSTNSGEVHPESSTGVVGYASIIFYDKNMVKNETGSLSDDEQKVALRIARNALRAAFDKKEYTPDIGGYNIFNEARGAFVTLRKQDALRGCIGLFEPKMKLSSVIMEMALSAAFEDGRFDPLREEELNGVDIEISVLSPMKKILSPDDIELGKHGVYVSRGERSGVYLPQVAAETGWDKNSFLNSLCIEKAGLEAGCWRDKATELFVFTAQVFKE